MSTQQSVDTPAAPQAAAVLAGRYRLDRRLAQGGMAEVWVGSDLLLTRQVAIKLLKPNLAADPIVAERFRREAIAVAQLSHPNIVTVYDAVEDDIQGHRRQAVVMQLISGKSLRTLLDDQSKLSPELTMHIGSCVANALDAAHRAGLVHRDVKPGNILITPDGRVLLTDFGIAKGVADVDDLTSENIMMGTAKYLSPEQVRGRRLDGRADLYSLGLVLYECLAGRVPFQGENDAETALARLNRDPTDIARLRPTLPNGLADLVHRLLARKPDDRFATGAEVRAALNAITARGATTTGQVPAVTGNTTPTRLARTGGSPASPMRSAPGKERRPSPTRPTPGGGYQLGHGGRPAGVPLRPDRTPADPNRPEPRPNRQNTQRHRPSMLLIGGLLFTAAVLAIVIFSTLHDNPARPLSTKPPAVSGTTAAPGAPTPRQPSLHLFDPDGDGSEPTDGIALAMDGSPATAWQSLCYQSSTLGGKRGVGLLLDLGQPEIGTLSVTVGDGPYGLQVLTAGDGPAPTQFEQMDIVKRAQGRRAGTVTASADSPARYLAVVFVGLPKDASCPAGRPFRGSLAELHWSAG